MADELDLVELDVRLVVDTVDEVVSRATEVVGEVVLLARTVDVVFFEEVVSEPGAIAGEAEIGVTSTPAIVKSVMKLLKANILYPIVLPIVQLALSLSIQCSSMTKKVHSTMSLWWRSVKVVTTVRIRSMR